MSTYKYYGSKFPVIDVYTTYNKYSWYLHDRTGYNFYDLSDDDNNEIFIGYSNNDNNIPFIGAYNNYDLPKIKYRVSEDWKDSNDEITCTLEHIDETKTAARIKIEYNVEDITLLDNSYIYLRFGDDYINTGVCLFFHPHEKLTFAPDQFTFNSINVQEMTNISIFFLFCKPGCEEQLPTVFTESQIDDSYLGYISENVYFFINIGDYKHYFNSGSMQYNCPFIDGDKNEMVLISGNNVVSSGDNIYLIEDVALYTEDGISFNDFQVADTDTLYMYYNEGNIYRQYDSTFEFSSENNLYYLYST